MLSEKLAASDLMTHLATAHRWALSPVETAHDLVRNLTGVHQSLRTLDIGRYDPKSLADNAPLLIDQLFQTRMALRERIGDWHRQGFLGTEMQKALRDVFRIMRYGSDMLGEMAVGFRLLPAPGQPLTGFTRRDRNTLVNPRLLSGQNPPF